jgi:hypothetical protein
VVLNVAVVFVPVDRGNVTCRGSAKHAQAIKPAHAMINSLRMMLSP